MAETGETPVFESSIPQVWEEAEPRDLRSGAT